MARKKDLPCTRCGALMWRDKRLPPEPVCRPCRSADAVLELTCPVCESVFSRVRSAITTPEPCCSIRCARIPDPLAPERRRSRDLARSRARKLRRAQTWDGVTDGEIFGRDGWRCQIPQCTYRSRIIRQDIAYPEGRSASVDHVVPLSEGGDDTSANKRASHLRCNLQRRNVGGNDQLALFGMPGEPRLRPSVAGVSRPVRAAKPQPGPKSAPPLPATVACHWCAAVYQVRGSVFASTTARSSVPPIWTCDACHNCGGCGKRVGVTRHSLPPELRQCHDCRCARDLLAA